MSVLRHISFSSTATKLVRNSLLRRNLHTSSATFTSTMNTNASSLSSSSSSATVRSISTTPSLENSPSLSTPTTSTVPSPPASSADVKKPSVQADSETPLTETVRYFLEPAELYSCLQEKGLDFYCGVPDSLLKDFCAYVTDTAPKEKHIITANEGAAVGLATGYHLATGKFPIVYMQNSGFGNTVNPLLSLCDPKVYSIPMLLLIGWRGEPGKKDEPQHIVQGKVMSSLLTDMNIQFEVLPDYIEGARESVETALHYLERRQGPYAFLVKRQTFTSYKLKSIEANRFSLSREDALRLVVDATGSWDVLVSTTGFASRELYELREQRGEDHKREFLTVGSMGHSSAISLGIAVSKPSRTVWCLDGDGATLMHMGSMATIGLSSATNLKHILINNGAHDSVGGQPTRGFDVNFTQIALACGYRRVWKASTEEEVKKALQEMKSVEGPVFLEISTNKGARKNLGRPKTTPLQNKKDFMDFLRG
jgi:phosphonopyruvate decarboxylase